MVPLFINNGPAAAKTVNQLKIFASLNCAGRYGQRFRGR
jgi:hypothetical protein